MPEPQHPAKDVKAERRYRTKVFPKNDPEVAEKSIDSPTSESPIQEKSNNTSHYEIARQMVSYQSVDVGTHCRLCAFNILDIFLIMSSPMCRRQLDARESETEEQGR